MIRARIGVRACDGYLIVAISGELDVVDAEAAGSVLAVAADGNPRLAVDMTGLQYIDCCALGVLARVRAQARQAGGDLLLAAPGPVARRVLALRATTPGFTVGATAAEAALTAGWAHARTPAPARPA